MTPHHLLWPLLCFVVFAFYVAQVAFLGWASPFLEPWHVCFVAVKPTRSVGDSAQLPSVVWVFCRMLPKEITFPSLDSN